jgi:DNA (cytosine-5)-methyltransferase 1
MSEQSVARRRYISLFSGGGIGDIGFRSVGLSPIVLNEISTQRAELCRLNFPEADVVAADLLSACDEIISSARAKLGPDELFLVSATPPCQGMSKNGIGTILKAMRDGKRPTVDDRNALFLPALKVVEVLRPKFFFFENVDRIFNFFATESERFEPIGVVAEIEQRLSRLGYRGAISRVDFADLGVPQHRVRAVGIFWRDDLGIEGDERALLPAETHGPRGSLKRPWGTVRAAIGQLPELDSSDRQKAASAFHHLHQVPVSRPDLYRWIRHTKSGCTAFENDECTECSNVNTRSAMVCRKCGAELPKPSVRTADGPRLIRGFVSSYKRMEWDEPSPTITTRSAYACSDHNLHPEQHRVLSLLEICLLQGLLPDDYRWGPVARGPGKNRLDAFAPNTLIRDILGEPVSPIVTAAVGKHLIEIEAARRFPEFARCDSQLAFALAT